MEKAFLRCRQLCFSVTLSRWSSVTSQGFTAMKFQKRSSSSGLAKDPSWEAEVLRHEKLMNELKDTGANADDLPVLEREQKVNSLPHISFHGKKEFEKEDALLSDTSRLLLGSIMPQDYVTSCNAINLDKDFSRNDVQSVLQRLHYSTDMEKAYRRQIQKRKEMPTIKYLTEQQLKEEMEKIIEQTKRKLRMLPIFNERSPCEAVLSEDNILDGHEQSNISFVDISDNLNQRERFIVIREPNGILRKGNWKERDRLVQTYYPKPYRKIIMPSIFMPANLADAFSRNMHENVLDQCVNQFEPDSKEYIDVCEAVYEDINKEGLFDVLRSTRYFGGFLFYLARTFQMDGMILNLVQDSRLNNASDCVKLIALLHPSCKTQSAIIGIEDEISILEAYIRSDSKIPEKLSTALRHSQQPSEEDKTAESSS